MTGTEVNLSAWAERTFAVLLLPFAFLVMVGGGAGMFWLSRDYGAQLWLSLCVITALAVLASVAWSVTSRHQRRRQWLAQRVGPAGDDGTAHGAAQLRSVAELESADSHELMLEMLSRIDIMQRNLDVLMGEFTSEQQRAGSGRHAGPITLDIRDDIEILDDEEDFDEFDDLTDFDDLPDFDGLDDDPDALDELSDVSLDDADSVDAGDTPKDSTNTALGSPDPESDPTARSDESPSGEAGTDEDTSQEIHQAPERRMRRLVHDRSSTQQQRDPIPAPREPVQVIELPRDHERDMEIEDDEDNDYFGSGLDETGDTMNDEEDDDERPRDAGS